MSTLVDSLNRAHGRVYTVGAAGGYAGPSLFAGSGDFSSPSTALAASLRDGDYQLGENGYDTRGTGALQSLAQPQQTFYRDATIDVRYALGFDVASRLTNRTDVATSGAQFLETFGYNTNTANALVSSISTFNAAGSETSSLFYTDFYDLSFATGSASRLNPSVQYTYTRDTGGRVTQLARRWERIGTSLSNGQPTTYT